MRRGCFEGVLSLGPLSKCVEIGSLGWRFKLEELTGNLLVVDLKIHSHPEATPIFPGLGLKTAPTFIHVEPRRARQGHANLDYQRLGLERLLGVPWLLSLGIPRA